MFTIFNKFNKFNNFTSFAIFAKFAKFANFTPSPRRQRRHDPARGCSQAPPPAAHHSSNPAPRAKSRSLAVADEEGRGEGDPSGEV